MSIEAMKQAAAAFDKIIDGCNGIDEEDTHPEAKKVARLVRKDCLRALEALCQAIAKAEKQEPVAWVYPEALEAFRQGKPWTAYGRDGNGPHTDGVERAPLYAAPVVCDDDIYDVWKEKNA